MILSSVLAAAALALAGPVETAPRDCTPPEAVKPFFSQFPQTSTVAVGRGTLLKAPYYFWGSGNLGLTGTVSAEKAAELLKPLGHEPFLVPTPQGQAALAGVFAPIYDGTCAGKYSSLFFGVFIKDNAVCDPAGNCAPGFVFLSFYADTELAMAAGQAWGIPEEKALRITSNFTTGQRRVRALVKGGTVTLAWRQDSSALPTTESQQMFRDFVPKAGFAPTRLIMAGREQAAPFDPARDQFTAGRWTTIGKTIAKLGGFYPYEWKHYSAFHGVHFPPQ
jgi:hypothetical protein